MNDSDGGPSTSRGPTRRSGANSPRTPVTPAMTKKRNTREESKASESSLRSQVSDSPSFANREEKNLFTPTYGGNLFTAPTSKKRETKKNSRFSPPPPETKVKHKVAADVVAASGNKKPINNLADTVDKLKTMKIEQQVFFLPPNFGGVGGIFDSYRQSIEGDTSKAATPARVKTAGRVPRAAVPPKPAKSTLAAFDFDEPSTSRPTKRSKSSPQLRVMKGAMKKEPEEEEEKEDEPQRGRKKTRGGEEKEKAGTPRGRLRFNVKEEPKDSDNEETAEAPVAKTPVKRGRKGRASLPSPVTDSSHESDKEEVAAPVAKTPLKKGRKGKTSLSPVAPAIAAAVGRRKSAAGALGVVKQEPVDDVPSTSAAIGRRKSGGMAIVKQEPADHEEAAPAAVGRKKNTVVVKQEPLDDDDAHESVGRRRTTRGGEIVMKGIVKTESEAEAAAATVKATRRSVSKKDDAPSDQQSTSDAAAAATPAAADRSLSRKRGRKASDKNEPAAEETPEAEPAAKRKDRRRSTRSTVETEEDEPMEVEKEKEKATPGKRAKRTDHQLHMDSMTEEEKAAAKADLGRGVTTRRHSTRSQGEESAAAAGSTPTAASSSRASPRVANQSGMKSALSRMVGRLSGTGGGEGEGDAPEPVPQNLLDDESVEKEGEEEKEAASASIGGARKTRRQKGGADAKEEEKKPSTSSSSVESSSSMLQDESTAAEDKSGYGEDSSQEGDTEQEEEGEEAGEESMDEGEEKDEEEGEEEEDKQASSSAEVRGKRGRGRPRKDGKPCQPTPQKAPRKVKEGPEPSPMVRDRRPPALNPKFTEYMKDETLKHAKRASAGAGTATTSRTLAAAGVKVDIPPPPTPPPPPEVKAPTGSALSIMRGLHKKKLPSVRSPSPIATRGRGGSSGTIGTIAAIAATIADAPPIESAAAAAEEKEKDGKEEDVAGSSRKDAPVKDDKSASDEKEDGEGEKKKKGDELNRPLSTGSAELAKLAEYGSSEDEEEKEKAAPAAVPTPPAFDDRNWLTPDDIRGKRTTKMPIPKEPVPVKSAARVKPAEEGKEEEKDEGEKEEEKGEGEEQEKVDTAKEAVESTSVDAAEEKKAETAQDLLARWTEQRKAIDEERKQQGLPVLPHEPAPIATRRESRRSIQAPSRFGDYDLNYGDGRKRGAGPVGSVGSPAAIVPESPVQPPEVKKTRSKKKEEGATAAAATTPRRMEGGEDEEEEKAGKGSGSKKDKSRPRIVLKLRMPKTSRSNSAADLTPAAGDEEGEEEEEQEEGGDEPMDESLYDGSEADSLADFPPPEATTSSASTLTKTMVKKTVPAKRLTQKDRRRPTKQYKKKWKCEKRGHQGFITVGKTVESVRLICAAVIDDLLLEICDDGIPQSTLDPKERASEQSLLSAAKRRASGALLPKAPPGAPRPKPLPYVPPPREERSKRVRHAPQSKEYDDLTVPLTAGLIETVPQPAFQAPAGLSERRPSDRRKESRQEAAIKKASLAAAVAVEVAAAPKEVEAPVEKSKKERKREREPTKTVNKNAIAYDEFIRQKTHDPSRPPGKVLNDQNDFFYRELFMDDPLSADVVNGDLDVDVEEFTAPVPDDTRVDPKAAVGVLAEESATKLLALLPRPAPYPDDDFDPEEEREWMEADMKKALSHHTGERQEQVEKILKVVSSQRAADLAVAGTKGAQDVMYTSHVKNAYKLKELLPIFSEFRQGESTWMHRSFIRLLPSYLLPVYLELFRFIKYLDSKHAAALNKALSERGVDEEWDALFEKEQTDDDRTEPMLNGSEHASGSNSLLAAAAANDVAATVESVLKRLEETEKEEEAAAAPAEAAVPSPDSEKGGLVIDEGPTEEEKAAAEAAAAAAASIPTEPAAAEVADPPAEVAIVEEVKVEEVKKPKADLRSVCSLVGEVSNNRVKEANSDSITNSMDLVKLGDIIPILVSPIFEMDDAPEEFVQKNKPCEYVFRMIRYATPFPSEFKTIKPRIPSGPISIAEAMDAAIDFVTAAVKAAVKNKGSNRVVLFGWGISCYINHRVVQTVHGVSAIVNFAFPLRTADGWRGTPDDDITLTYCPTLFVMGEEADDFDPVQLTMLRMYMIQPAGALVMGNSDANLNVSSLRLSRERITQKVAARMMLEQVIEFINLPANQLERAKLVPCQLNNVYFVEPAALKAFTGQEAQQALMTGSSGRRTSYGAPSIVDPMAMSSSHSQYRRQQQAMQEEKRRKRSRIDEQTTAAGRLASSIAASAAPITKRSRTDEGGGPVYGERLPPLAQFRFSAGPSPLASPAMHSPAPGGYRMNRPAILSHSHQHNPHHYYGGMQPSPMGGGPSTSAASGMLLQTASNRPANAAAAAAPSPRGPLDPASISLA